MMILTPYMLNESWDSSVGIATGLTAEELGFDTQHKQEIFLLSTASRPALETVSPRVKWQGREDEH
jgi:hypothetical protein